MNDAPVAAPSVHTSDPFSLVKTTVAHISNPFCDSGIELSTKTNSFDDNSFDRAFNANDAFVTNHPTFDCFQTKDTQDLPGINFSSIEPPAPVPTNPPTFAQTTYAPDYSHINYDVYCSSVATTKLLQAPANAAKEVPKNVASTSIGPDFFESAAASAFKQFGAIHQSKLPAFTSSPKKSLADRTEMTPRQDVAGNGSSLFGLSEKVI